MAKIKPPRTSNFREIQIWEARVGNVTNSTTPDLTALQAQVTANENVLKFIVAECLMTSETWGTTEDNTDVMALMTSEDWSTT